MLGTNFRANTGSADVSIQNVKCYHNKTKQNGKYYFTAHDGADEDYINDLADEINDYNPAVQFPTINMSSAVSITKNVYLTPVNTSGIYYGIIEFTAGAYDYSATLQLNINIKPMNDSIVVLSPNNDYYNEFLSTIRNMTTTQSGITVDIRVGPSPIQYKLVFLGEVIS